MKNKLQKKTTTKGDGITVTNNEIKDITKVIKSVENRRIFLKGTARKITSQKEGFPNFIRPILTDGLPLIKNVLTPSAKGVLTPLKLTAASAADAAIPKKI